jgi:hypothetical protein
MPVIPALERLSQEDHNFAASMGYTSRPCLKKKERKRERCDSDSTLEYPWESWFTSLSLSFLTCKITNTSQGFSQTQLK